MSLTTSAWHKADEPTEKKVRCERGAGVRSFMKALLKSWRVKELGAGRPQSFPKN